SELLPGVENLISYLSENDYAFGFLSNNSTKTISDYIKKFQSFGIKVTENQVISAVQVTIEYLISLKEKIKTLYVIGESGLKKSLTQAKFNVVNEKTDEIDAVIVGMDRNFNYRKLSIGLQACLQGARFIATGIDPQFPTSNGFFPGAGSMVGALKSALNGQDPEMICGKPNPLIATRLLEKLKLDPKQVVLIGDRVSTDMQCAKNAKLSPVLIKTGFGKIEYRQYPNFPYYSVINSLFDVFV
ncbi:MAG: HAD-IIA family hydrolase, partial [Candidatus Heimdallarchaeota archaeon]